MKTAIPSSSRAAFTSWPVIYLVQRRREQVHVLGCGDLLPGRTRPRGLASMARILSAPAFTTPLPFRTGTPRPRRVPGSLSSRSIRLARGSRSRRESSYRPRARTIAAASTVSARGPRLKAGARRSSARAREHLRLERQRVEETWSALGGLVDDSRCAAPGPRGGADGQRPVWQSVALGTGAPTVPS